MHLLLQSSPWQCKTPKYFLGFCIFCRIIILTSSEQTLRCLCVAGAGEAAFSESGGSSVSKLCLPAPTPMAVIQLQKNLWNWKWKLVICEIWQVSSSQEEAEPSLKEAGTEVDWHLVGPIIAGRPPPHPPKVWHLLKLSFLLSGCSRPGCFLDCAYCLLSQKEVQVYHCDSENSEFSWEKAT